MKLKAILVGCGDRTCVYAEYAVNQLHGIEVVAAVDPDIERKILKFTFLLRKINEKI